MKALIFILVLAVSSMITETAFANGPWQRLFQDVKTPSQAQTEHQIWALPLGSSASLLKSGASISSSAATTISSFAAQPDFPRNIVLTPTGTTANTQTGTAVVSGLSIFGKSISENFAIVSNSSAAVTGSKAFKSVSSVVFPQASGSGVTLSIGIGTKLGLNRCLANAGDYDFSEYGGVYETTRGTIANSATAIESNTFIPNGSEDAAHNIDLFFIQNFRCYPGQ